MKDDDGIRVNVRMVDRPDFQVHVSLKSSVKYLREKVQIALGFPTTTAIRLIYLGKVLDDDSRSLHDLSFFDQCHIHCSPAPRANHPPPHVAVQIEEPQRFGFDRLREFGFSSTDIAEIRAQFQPNSHLQSEEDFVNNMIDSNHRPSEQEAQLSIAQELQNRQSEGSYEDLFLGMVMGFLLGFIVVFFLWDKSLSRRTKFGIVAGVGCNVSFSLFAVEQGI
eukprot:TRINITY_DN881_c0_g4_i1.p1 TRINITY_DN881_c0_g4~~TRINITY_DN881_c0_g4_i1.p1  ORF type:complete len:233 (+),score=40.94 TRINITY_DN881_c0_g4_i1:39-701(+)